ncbi:MAG: outer membrane protein assembly factor BamD [Acidobacteriota bacterium]
MTRRRLLLILGMVFLTLTCGPKKPPPSDEDLYRFAEEQMTKHKYNKALTAYEKIKATNNRELRAQVHLRRADAFFAQKNALSLSEAQTLYRSFLNLFPLSHQAPYAQYRLGLCLMRQINPPERDQSPTHTAMAAFQKVLDLYPNSDWVGDARDRLQDLNDHLARDSLAKAHFYFRAKAYKATVTRLKSLLKENPGFRERDQVLYYLGLALRRSHHEAEGDQFLERLSSEFPESKYTRKAKPFLPSSKPSRRKGGRKKAA